MMTMMTTMAPLLPRLLASPNLSSVFPTEGSCASTTSAMPDNHGKIAGCNIAGLILSNPGLGPADKLPYAKILIFSWLLDNPVVLAISAAARFERPCVARDCGTTANISYRCSLSCPERVRGQLGNWRRIMGSKEFVFCRASILELANEEVDLRGKI